MYVRQAALKLNDIVHKSDAHTKQETEVRQLDENDREAGWKSSASNVPSGTTDNSLAIHGSEEVDNKK